MLNRKRSIIAATAAALCFAANVCFAAATGGSENLDRELKDMVGDKGTKVPGIGVMVYKNGEEAYENFFGNAVIDYNNPQNNKPFTRDTRFRLASVSKQFTMFTIMQLVEKGKIDLDADASKYLGFTLRNPNYPDTPITVRMLAAHISSLRDGNCYSVPPDKSIKECFEPTGRYYENGEHFAPKGQAPGKYFSYCNLNYGVLGTIIERVTGERFDKYQKNHILKQLDIKGGYSPGEFTAKELATVGTIYRKRDKYGKWDENGPWHATKDNYGNIAPDRETVTLPVPYADNYSLTRNMKNYKVGTNATVFSPQGGLRISAEELSHALVMLMNGGTYKNRRVLKPESVAQMIDKVWVYDENKKNGNTYGGVMLSYGLGEYQIDGKSSARVCKDYVFDFVGHTGVAYGLLSAMFFNPETKDGYLYIINGLPMDEDNDERSFGSFSGNYIWEEQAADAICRNILASDAKE